MEHPYSKAKAARVIAKKIVGGMMDIVRRRRRIRFGHRCVGLGISLGGISLGGSSLWLNARLTYQFQETTCATIVAGPNWLEVTVGVADSSPGVPGQGSQKHVLRAFTTGDALLQEGKVGGAKSAGIGL